MKRLYPWYLPCAAVLLVCELLFSRNARISLLVTALIVLVLIVASALVSAIARRLLPAGVFKDALLRLRSRRAAISRDQPPR
jgi:hypothetical protein